MVATIKGNLTSLIERVSKLERFRESSEKHDKQRVEVLIQIHTTLSGIQQALMEIKRDNQKIQKDLQDYKDKTNQDILNFYKNNPDSRWVLRST